MSEAYETPQLFPPNGVSDSSDAPTTEAQPGKFDAKAAEEARQAHLVSLGGREYDPNARRAEQTQGAGGGISDAVAGTLQDEAEEASSAPRVLKIGSYFNGAPIRNDEDLKRAIATQRAQEIQSGKRSISRLDPVAQGRVERGIDQARTVLATVSKEPAPTKPQGIGSDFDSTIFDQVIPEGRELPNQPSKPDRRSFWEPRVVPYVEPPRPPRPR